MLNVVLENLIKQNNERSFFPFIKNIEKLLPNTYTMYTYKKEDRNFAEEIEHILTTIRMQSTVCDMVMRVKAANLEDLL